MLLAVYPTLFPPPQKKKENRKKEKKSNGYNRSYLTVDMAADQSKLQV